MLQICMDFTSFFISRGRGYLALKSRSERDEKYEQTNEQASSFVGRL